ncbi:MAG: hypothetical protein JXA25_18955 [Anaerolineales bacterium]|nr:hypothetical protein [Anaerolineales bacterium]
MNNKPLIAVFLVATFLLPSCSSAPTSPAPQLAAAAAGEPETPPRSPLTLEADKLYVALLWHQHQPVYYKDPDTGIYERPWVRVHASKDYVDMAAILQEYPAVHATFNLTPSLIRQLDDYADGARDSYWVHAEIPADDLTDEQKQFLLDRFFDINPSIIAHFPRYAVLAAKRGEDALRVWTAADFRDLQVFFNLAWTDPDWLAQEPLASLVAKGEGFSEEDKAVLFAEHLRLIQEVIPLHTAMQQSGQIEITLTPFAHPILPLLVDSDLARVALPDADLPTRFVYGQDAVAQLDLGIELYLEHFNQAPRGMWPAEGSVAEQVVSMISRAGIQWIATDEDVLAGSLPEVADFTRDSQDTVLQAGTLYQPYAVQGARGEPVAILFRDHVLSDKVGFEYSGTPGEEAAADFVTRLENIHARLDEEGAQGPHLVTVLLDGENAWEYYENDGKAFLHEMYRLLSESDTLVTVTPSEYLDAVEEAGYELPKIEDLWAGSWIDGTFSTWIGEEDENLAWEYLRRTREALKEAESELEPEALEKALQLMYIAEGSDWFWWYGADQNSGADENFDRQFRSYLEQIYTTIGLDVPDFVHVPVIPQIAETPAREPVDLLAVTADGTAAEGEWENAGLYLFDTGPLGALFYGFDQETLYLRLDASECFSDGDTYGFYLSTPEQHVTNATTRSSGETLGFGLKQLIEITMHNGCPSASVYNADGAGSWILFNDEMPFLERVAVQDGMLELAVPFDKFSPNLRSGDRIYLRLAAPPGEETAILPEAGPVLAVVPDLPITNVFLEVRDPENDDHGPGTYIYPKDVVFKPGVFDITGFTAGFDDQDYLFRVQFRGPVINEWGSPNGLSIQTIDLYIDSDGPSSGTRLLLPGRNAALTANFAWDRAIWVEGWYPGVFEPSAEGPVQIDTGFTILTNPGKRQVTIRVPQSLLPGDPEEWKIALAVLSQEGYPSSGVWRVRDVGLDAEQWVFGGGTGSPADTRIMDMLWPAGEEPPQESLLSHAQGADVDLNTLAADDYPLVPAVP